MSIAHTLRCHFVLSKVQCGPSFAESVYRYYVNGNIILSTKNNNEIKISFANALFYTAPFTIPHTLSYQRAKAIPTNEYYITRRQHWLSPPLSFSYNHNRIPYNPIVWQCLWPIISVHNPIIIIISQYTITASTIHWSHLNPSILPSVRLCIPVKVLILWRAKYLGQHTSNNIQYPQRELKGPQPPLQLVQALPEPSEAAVVHNTRFMNPSFEAHPWAPATTTSRQAAGNIW